MHIHVSHPDGEAKFWLSPSIELARNIGLSSSTIKDAERLALSCQQEIIASMPGTTTLEAEVTNVFRFCIWMLIYDEELALPYSEFPWFKAATIEQVINVRRPTADHLYWPELDVDLSVESIRNPKRFPLRAKSIFQACHSPKPPPQVH
ncbi:MULTISPECIES: DUF2442 domain-containing protein [unclassified Synechococcus]|uniref:DUF2442 domain-containing protein n=1 Tax=unclassified Synechococcus TaxID=2626047 RepID=UPI0021A8F983|nr:MULTISPECIES: DUF2442 domain-containing protein [unclassified Synechococcus]MCT0212159.1 DUF2442 domain-containing protein [Synechococcus sp. CS-1326]MCT0232665.1 DUF2442 domain-containing protein [Synechococcus sp. CS-1327]